MIELDRMQFRGQEIELNSSYKLRHYLTGLMITCEEKVPIISEYNEDSI